MNVPTNRKAKRQRCKSRRRSRLRHERGTCSWCGQDKCARTVRECPAILKGLAEAGVSL